MARVYEGISTFGKIFLIFLRRQTHVNSKILEQVSYSSLYNRMFEILHLNTGFTLKLTVFYFMEIGSTKKYPKMYSSGYFYFFEVVVSTYFKGLNSKLTTPRLADFTSKDLVAKKEKPLSFL